MELILDWLPVRQAYHIAYTSCSDFIVDERFFSLFGTIMIMHASCDIMEFNQIKYRNSFTDFMTT